MLSVSLQDGKGRPILTLENNFLSFSASHLVDVRCPPQARSFEVKSNGGELLKLQHKRFSLDEFIDQIPASTFNKFDTPEIVKKLILQSDALDSEGMLPVIEISGDLNSKDIELKLNRNKSTMLMKSYRNELVNIHGRFYFPHLSSGALIIKFGEKEILKFG